MDVNESTVNAGLPAGRGWKLFAFLSKIDTQTISFIILMLLSAQVFFGLFQTTPSQMDLASLYYGKTAIIRFLGYLGILNWLIDFYCKCFIHKERTLKWTFLMRPWTGLFALLLMWSAFAIIIARDKSLAFFGGAYRFEGYLSYLAYAGLFLNASLIKSEKYRKILFVTTAAVSTALAALTLLKELAHVPFLMNRSGYVGAYSATFINSNHYGYYLCVSMAVIAGLFVMAEKIRDKIIFGCCFAVNMVVMLYNASLGPYLAIALGLVLLFVFSWIRKGFRKAWPVLILIAVLVAFSFVINGHKMIDDMVLITKQLGNVIGVIESGSTDSPEGQQAINTIGSSRGVLWKKTIKVMLEHPEMGIGTDNIQLYIDNQIPHNEYLQVGANLGIPGLLMYLGALVSCLVFALKNLKKISDGALIAGTATLVYCVSAFMGISIPIATYQLFLFLGLLTGWFKNRDEEKMNAKILEELAAGTAAESAGSDEGATSEAAAEDAAVTEENTENEVPADGAEAAGGETVENAETGSNG
ncbi:MAG: O-antigen ligase family protein [Clostridia bacterium]|nr:O-antigen ligase family protein [Clostridia bacterium]